jgi:rSAM/selenodomain-associated transferase 1
MTCGSEGTPSDRVLGIFAKAPRPGAVKTRLAKSLGDEAAARLYEAFLRDLLERLQAVNAHRVLAFASESDAAYCTGLCGSGYELTVQIGVDLGARMAAFFQQQFAAGARRVVLVGSDAPGLPVERIEKAFCELQYRDVVIGPCNDGGYYLIAMRRLIDSAFCDIDWSTDRVFQQTINRLHERQVSHSVLDPWYDVDISRDLLRLNLEIAALRQAGDRLSLRHSEAVLGPLLVHADGVKPDSAPALDELNSDR